MNYKLNCTILSMLQALDHQDTNMHNSRNVFNHFSCVREKGASKVMRGQRQNATVHYLQQSVVCAPQKERRRLQTESTVITGSITTVDHEAKNHCNFSIADTSRPVSYISERNGKVTETDPYNPSRKKIKILIKYKYPYRPTGLHITSFLHLYSAPQLIFTV